MKVILFGTGEYYNRYKIWFSHTEVIGLIDNSMDKQGTYIDELPVFSPEEAVTKEFDAIFIMSFYVTEMKKQLMGLGIDENKIHHFFDIHDLIFQPSLKQKVMYYGALDQTGRNDRRILLLNTDLTLGGPALALFHAARVLKKSGYSVTYGSPLDGPLREHLETEGIPVVIDLNLLVETMEENEWVKEYSLIICNTINYHIFLSKRDTSIPVVWWLHDALFFYEGINRRAIDSISRNNLRVWVVGAIPEKAIKLFRPDLEVENLLYGVQDFYKKDISVQESTDGIVKFVTIGYIEERKGQDILIRAIRQLPDDIRKQARFRLIGQDTSMLANKIRQEVRDMAEIEFLGLVDRERINGILEESDMMICPSREDPMPTVCAEAMMFSVPCIVSNATGTAKYVSSWKDGIVFRSEDSKQLADMIEWSIAHKKELRNMGEKARSVFETQFSMDVFEERLLELIGHI